MNFIEGLYTEGALKHAYHGCIHDVRFNSRLNLIAVGTRNGCATKTMLTMKSLCGSPRIYVLFPTGWTNGPRDDSRGHKELSNDVIASHIRCNIKIGSVRRLGKSSTVSRLFFSRKVSAVSQLLWVRTEPSFLQTP